MKLFRVNSKRTAATPQTEAHRPFCFIIFYHESQCTPTQILSSSLHAWWAQWLWTWPRPAAIRCNMRYESRAGVLASPQVTECTQTNSSSKVNTGQSGFICASPIAGVHGNKESSHHCFHCLYLYDSRSPPFSLFFYKIGWEKVWEDCDFIQTSNSRACLYFRNVSCRQGLADLINSFFFITLLNFSIFLFFLFLNLHI